MTGAEISQHMCDVAAEAVIHNGFGARCIMVRSSHCAAGRPLHVPAWPLRVSPCAHLLLGNSCIAKPV